MLKKIIKIVLTILGSGILVAGIINEIDGIGRFAMILFGVVFSMVGSFMSFENKDTN